MMKKYIVTIFGDFKTNEVCNEIAINLTTIVDSPNLKFQFTKGTLIFHFASELDIEEVHEFLELSRHNLFDSFILSEYTDKVSVFMSEENKKHLFDLDNNTDSNGMDMVFVPKDANQCEEEYDDEFVALILNEVKKNLKTPTLDQLLEKIKSDGVDSLTTYEIGILENYSKN
jgi:hypothetical protein